ADVRGDALWEPGAQDLDRDGPPVAGRAAMDLRDRGRPDGHWIDLGIDIADRPLEAALDLGADGLDGERGQAVLQREQFVRGFGPDEVGTGGEGLAELDRRRSDRLE